MTLRTDSIMRSIHIHLTVSKVFCERSLVWGKSLRRLHILVLKSSDLENRFFGIELLSI